MRTIFVGQVFAMLAVATCAAAQPGDQAMVRLTSRTVVIDRQAAMRAGVSYVDVGGGRLGFSVPPGRRGGTVAVQGPLGVRAFLEIARERRWTRSESSQMVMVASGSEGRVSSLSGTVSPYEVSSRGPVLRVSPRVMPDGRVELALATGVEDRRESVWGYGVDASPAWAETVIVARPGEPVVVASSTQGTSTRGSGILHVGSRDRNVETFIVVTAEVVR
ncbi:MAG: hypothetical protein AVDCRST_MAG89-4582 [uncultured Gemmatimonadetes bacterium]|uniref:Uncharacterized protein n=1 Tax=uncultured Gemmatimonadota bacterium TaxID=203437 RepID=A0A6J4N272_9BACT|nr:MAG: hypothetical protein AVDCRST_MAG89-4582 [uncultured Gemmatimonadota bacterium]